jgi:hypothetical protein
MRHLEVSDMEAIAKVFLVRIICIVYRVGAVCAAHSLRCDAVSRRSIEKIVLCVFSGAIVLGF